MIELLLIKIIEKRTFFFREFDHKSAKPKIFSIFRFNLRNLIKIYKVLNINLKFSYFNLIKSKSLLCKNFLISKQCQSCHANNNAQHTLSTACCSHRELSIITSAYIEAEQASSWHVVRFYDSCLFTISFALHHVY